jgi:hypothetical protein
MVSVRRVVPVLLLAMAVPAFAAKAPRKSAVSHAPRELHRAGDHWTAYNPPNPASYPAGAKSYTVKRGDTLWALAKQFYGNAYLWPQLWESNTYITDAHWIYPGDPLLIEGETGAAAVASGTTATATRSTATTPATAAATGATAQISPVLGAPVPLGTEADVYCYGYIGDPNEPMPNRISGFEDVELLYEAGTTMEAASVGALSTVFIDGGTNSGIVAGSTYLLVEAGGMITNPATKQEVGRNYEYHGQVRILCASETKATGLITQSCKEIHLGARLKPLPQLPIPLVRVALLPGICDPISGKTTGYIVQSEGYQEAIGTGNLVQITIGAADQLQPGDFVTVFRESPITGQPRQILGEIGILTTQDRTATGKITQMRLAMRVGDRVEIR